MAGNTGGEKYIGKLMLDVSEVQKQITEVNTWLGKIGANINLEDKLSQKVSAALQKLVNEAKQAGEEASKALAEGASKSKFDTIYEKMEQKMLAFENKMQAEAEKAIAKANQRAEREAAATERAEERKRQAREKQEQRYQQVWDKAARDREAQDAKEAANIDKQIAKYEAQDAKRAASAEKAAEREEQARAKKEAAYNDMWHRAEQQREQELAAEEAKLEQEVAKAEEAAQRKAQIEEEAAAKAAAARAKQEADYQLVWDKASYEQRQAAIRQYQQDIENYSKALAAYFTEIDNLQKQLVSGNVTEGSERYKAFTDNIARLKEEAQQAGASLDQAGKQTAASMQNVQTAVANLSKSSASIRDSKTPDYLKQVTAAYNTLRDAINNYNIAKKANNTSDMQTWQAEIDKQMGVISGVEQIVGSLNIEKNVREQIVLKIQEAKTLQDGFTKGVVGGTTAASELESQMTGLLTRMFSIMAVIRSISSLIQNTVEYVSEYSDKMNEIQMITLKTDAEVAELADTYRNLAEMMNVSSLDMADAAIYFTRQGLGAAEIEKRLKNVTMYAKAANVEFKDASEIVTAVVNSMGLAEQEMEDGRNAAQRVADVFLKVGDSAATSGQEIGEAMQKAAASAGAFGMSFEWLASYIATVSETTRQEARTIGTALNTIIARLHQIKQQGYNSEDETKINDVQKALAKIGVTLMDNNNEWRDMDTIFQEIGAQWDTLDGKTKSYIATTMAGVKQQNVFLALMNDLGKENLETTEHESRAWELYTKAIDSAGTAEEKYAVYKDSVAASQERLNIAQEKFYSLLDSDVIKSWNNALAGFINILNDGAAAMNGWNIAIPAIVAALTALVAVVIKFDAIASTLMAHPVIATIGLASVALVGLTTVISGIAAEIGSAKARFDEANQALSESRERMSELTAAQTQVDNLFADLQDGAKLTSEDLQKYNAQLEQIARVSPAAKTIVDQLKSGFIDQEEAVRKLNEEMERLIGNENKYSQVQLLKKYANWQPDETANDSMLYYLNSSWTNWTWGHEQMDDWTDAQKFAYNLKQNWMDTSSVSKMPAEVRQLIENTRKDLLQNKSLTEEQKWGIIGQLVWQEFVGTDSYSIDDALKSRAQSIVDDAINSLSAGLNPTEIKALQRNLMNMLLGEDGKMDEAEYKDIGSKMAKFMSGVIANGIQFSDIDMAEAVAESLFGTSTEGLFAEQGEAFAKKFVDQYNAAIKAGFTDSDIAKIFAESGLPTMELDRIGEILKEALQKNIADALGQEDFLSLVDWNENWGNADLTTLKLVKDYMDLGIEIEEIDELLANSESVDEFREKLATLGQELSEDVPEAAEEAKKTFADLIKEIKSFVSEVDDINGIIETLKNGEEVKISDMLDIASSHPEIMAFLNDTNELINQLERIKQESKNGVVSDVRNMILGNEDVMKNSPFSEYMTDDIKTLGQYANTLDETSAEMAEVSRYVELATAQFLAATGQVDKIDVNKIKELQSILFGRSNVDLNNRPTIDASKLTEAGWSNAGEGIATVFSSSYKAGKEGIKWNEDVIVSVTPILENGDVMSPDALDKYMDELFAKSGNIDELRQNDTKGLVIDVTAVADNESFADAESRVESLMVLLHKLQEVLYGTPEGEKSWLEEQVEAAAKTAELEWAKSNAYTEQLGELAYTVQNEGVREAIEVWDVYDEKLQKAIAETYPDLAKSILEAKQAIDEETGSEEKQAKATDSMTKAISKYQKYATAQNFTKTYAAIQKLEKGTISAAEAFDTFYSETDKITKAQEEINTATDKMADGVELAASDVNDLAGVLGISADQILQDFPGAVDMFNQLIGETGDLRAAFDALNEAAFIRITGVSEADFSAIENGLFAVRSDAEDVIKLLEATGQWEVVPIELPQEAKVWDPFSKTYTTAKTAGSATVLKATGNNPYKGTNKSNYSGSNNKKSGGGGGGGGNKNNDSNQMTEVELMLNRMEQMQAIIESQQGFYSAQSNYYKQTGHLQGVIGYSQKEIQVLEAQNDVLKQNIEQIDKYRQQKEAELEALDVSDEKYEEVRDDLDRLQKAHQEYTKQVIENETAIDQLNETIKETQKQIRDMQIKIREQIYKAIEDREKKAKNMLQNEITMENTILDIIKRKYEIERDKIIENTDARITALQEEKDLLSEQLRIRKEMAEEEDKAAKLAQLEANYNRIIADPTRAKEAQKIQDEISSLRKEMAWDAAEKEVKAQQDSIDQQITSLEDYKQYIEEYYEDLFAHPAKLIEEMRNIITRTDDEILDWLKENSEEYAASSENTQRQMVDTWSDTLDEMRGRIKTYWDEVEEIIAGGDDNIIQFLIDNSEDYAKAGKLQAEKYVDEWQEELEDLHKALESAFTIDAPNYVVMDPGTGGSSGGGSGGGGGGGSSGGNQKNQQETQKEDHGYSFVYKNKRYSDTGYVSKRQAQNGANNHIDRLRSGATKAEADRWESLARDTLYVYKNGGIADFTGPAWLDGSTRNPERILSPYQTKLFESMVQALEKMSTISIPSMPNFGGITAGSESNVSVGDIIVNVDNLDTDDDYEELARKVSEVLMERIGRTAVVGGLRINSI